MKMTGETLFCIKYLLEHGVDSSNFDDNVKLLETFDVPEYKLVKQESDTFFTELAEKLRELWPPGEKDGKYPWRDSVKNLTTRLKILWKERGLEKFHFNMTECLEVARRYLAQFENDTRYMKTLKYFIYKQSKIVAHDGKITYTFSSQFADMLETNGEYDMLSGEWERMMNDETLGEGVLI